MANKQNRPQGGQKDDHYVGSTRSEFAPARSDAEGCHEEALGIGRSGYCSSVTGTSSTIKNSRWQAPQVTLAIATESKSRSFASSTSSEQ